MRGRGSYDLNASKGFARRVRLWMSTWENTCGHFAGIPEVDLFLGFQLILLMFNHNLLSWPADFPNHFSFSFPVSSALQFRFAFLIHVAYLNANTSPYENINPDLQKNCITSWEINAQRVLTFWFSCKLSPGPLTSTNLHSLVSMFHTIKSGTPEHLPT